jgi:two-component system, LytTR family, sensor kinase
MTERMHDEPPTRWGWIVGIWLAGGLFEASQAVLIMRAEGRTGDWLPLFGTEFVSWLPWVLATPLIIRFTRRFPLFPSRSIAAVAAHLATFVTASAVMETWSAVLQMLFNPWHNRQPPTFMDTWSISLIYQILTFVIVYALIVTATFVMDSRDKMARQDVELSKAQLAALQRQMEPHFMYNTLHSIAGLVRDRSNDAAVSMIVGLSEFMRRASDDSHRAEVTLAQEVEYLQRYLDIQRMRFGDRLEASVEVPANLLGAEVPNLLLQPLVENAIKHGIGRRAAGGAVRISGEREGGELRLRIYNDGPGSPVDLQAARTGVGIGNLRTRLQILHGGVSRLELRQIDGGGIEVLVTLPYKVA